MSGWLDDDQEMPDIASRYTPVDWHEAWKQQPEDVEWLIEPVLEAGTVNALFAKPGTGKSLIALEWALKLVRAGRTAVYVDDENRVTDIVERLQAMGARPAELGRLRLYSFAGLPPLDMGIGGAHLLALAADAEAALVVLDTTSRLVVGKENDSDTFLNLYKYSMRPLKSRGITVLRLDHPGKDAERGQRGSSAKDGDVDTIWRLAEEQRGKKYRLYREKSRSGHGELDAIEVERRYDPLSHFMSVPDSNPKKTLVGQLSGQLDALGVPPSAGRDRCRTVFQQAGIPVRNDLLSDVVRYRKTRPDSSGTGGDSGDSQSPGRRLSPLPPHVVGGNGTGDGDPSPNPRPDCLHAEEHNPCSERAQVAAVAEVAANTLFPPYARGQNMAPATPATAATASGPETWPADTIGATQNLTEGEAA